MKKRSHMPLPPRYRHGGAENIVGLKLEGYTIGQWTPLPNGLGKTEAVAITLHMGMDQPDLTLRLKSRQAVNEMIEQLEMHRDGVWGPEPDADPM